MIRTPVKSSFIAAIGYEGDRLEVQFANGKVYMAEGITPAAYADLIGAESIGAAFNALRKTQTMMLLPEQKDADREDA